MNFSTQSMERRKVFYETKERSCSGMKALEIIRWFFFVAMPSSRISISATRSKKFVKEGDWIKWVALDIVCNLIRRDKRVQQHPFTVDWWEQCRGRCGAGGWNGISVETKKNNFMTPRFDEFLWKWFCHDYSFDKMRLDFIYLTPITCYHPS